MKCSIGWPYWMVDALRSFRVSSDVRSTRTEWNNPPPPDGHSLLEQKLRKAHEGKPADMTLQELVQAEIDEKKTGAKNSSTDALLWLKRALLFMRHFLGNVTEGDRSEKGAVKVGSAAPRRPRHCHHLCRHHHAPLLRNATETSVSSYLPPPLHTLPFTAVPLHRHSAYLAATQ